MAVKHHLPHITYFVVVGEVVSDVSLRHLIYNVAKIILHTTLYIDNQGGLEGSGRVLPFREGLEGFDLKKNYFETEIIFYFLSTIFSYMLFWGVKPSLPS